MIQVDMPEIQPEFASLLNLLDQQDTDALLITQNGRPLAKLTRPMKAVAPKSFHGQRIGIAKGKFTVPDDFDKWDVEVTDLFEEHLL